MASQVKISTDSSGAKRVCFGNCDYVVTAMEYERDDKNGDSYVLTYEAEGSPSAGMLPAIGSGVNVMSGLHLSKAVATSAEGGVTTIKLTFSESQTEGDGGGDDAADEEEDGSGNDDTAKEAAETGKYGYKCSLDVTLTDEPLLTHPKFSGTSGATLEYVKALMDGARMWELVPVVDRDGKPQVDKDGLPIKKRLGSLLQGGGKLVELAQKGVTTYKSPAATFSESYVSKSGSVDTSGVGQVGKPGGAPVFKGRDWLLVSRNASLNDDGKTYTVSSVWMLSGVGGWDSDLYGG